MRLLWLLAILSLSFSVAVAQNPAKINVGDVLTLHIVGFDEFSGDLTVASDGRVSGPGIGHLDVADSTLEQAEVLIKDRLGRLLNDPILVLSFKSQAHSAIFVVGAPVPGGRVDFVPGLDLRRVFSGLTFTDPGAFQVTVNRGGSALQTVKLSDLLENPDTWSGPLESGDLVVVSRTASIRIWMVGRIRESGERSVPEGSTLSQAIADAGGFNLTDVVLDRMMIHVRRGVESFDFEGRLIGKAADFVLLAGDTVTVEGPKSISVFVTGEVRSPRRLILEDGEDLFSAISDTGGINSAGTLTAVMVFRDGGVHRVNLQERLTSVEEYKPFPLMHDDIVIVPKNQNYIYVLGKVVKPGRYVIPDQTQFHATDALALAEGISTGGTHRRVSLGRVDENGEYQVQSFNIDEFLKDGIAGGNPILQPGDVIFFGQPKGVGLADLARFLSSALLIEALIN